MFGGRSEQKENSEISQLRNAVAALTEKLENTPAVRKVIIMLPEDVQQRIVAAIRENMPEKPDMFCTQKDMVRLHSILLEEIKKPMSDLENKVNESRDDIDGIGGFIDQTNELIGKLNSAFDAQAKKIDAVYEYLKAPIEEKEKLLAEKNALQEQIKRMRAAVGQAESVAEKEPEEIAAEMVEDETPAESAKQEVPVSAVEHSSSPFAANAGHIAELASKDDEDEFRIDMIHKIKSGVEAGKNTGQQIAGLIRVYGVTPKRLAILEEIRKNHLTKRQT